MLALAQVSAAETLDPQLAKLVGDLDKGGLSAKGDLATVAIIKMGTAAAAAEPLVLPLLDHKNGNVRFRAVRVLAAIHPGGNQEALRRTALRETDRETCRVLAEEALTDEAELAEVVRRAPRPMRERAAMRLAKSPLLAQIATTDPDPQVRGDALFAVSDRAVLAQLSQDPSPEVRRWAEAAAAADAKKDLAVSTVKCQRGYDPLTVLCNVTVANSGAVAYDDLQFQMRGVAGGTWRGTERVEPGETKKIVALGNAGTEGGTVVLEVRGARRYRPAR